MSTDNNPSQEIFSYHILKVSWIKLLKLYFLSKQKSKIAGLKHCEFFFQMGLGSSVFSRERYQLNNQVFFAWWENEGYLEKFQSSLNEGNAINNSWHVRMKLYRKWGSIKELSNSFINDKPASEDNSVVAVTLARLKLTQTLRFLSWGKPVEKQIRDHKGKTLALAAMRPFNSFSTFSIWKNEQEMTNMVHGKNVSDGKNHAEAMKERERKDFHYEFTTMRFIPISEHGVWEDNNQYIDK